MLYIMRHGKTDWNEQHKLQGRTDIPLNDDGIKMAEAAALKYKDVHFDICYCSPLKRAKKTAEILLAGRDIPIISDDRLVEMSFGKYEGVKSSFSTDANKLKSSDSQVNILFDVLIVGHGAMNSSIVCRIKNIGLDRFWSAGIENCKLMKLM